LVQITKTLPARRTILQLSQIRLTLDRTFMAVVLSYLDPAERRPVVSTTD
jgi:hypothetical protein